MAELKIGSPVTTYTQPQTNSNVVTEGKENSSIFTFSGDKNNNGVVDFDDFADKEETKLFSDKGLLGKPWQYVKEYVGKLFNIKSAKVVIPDHDKAKVAHNEITVDKDGKVISDDYIMDKDLNGHQSYEKRNYSYDEQGNIKSFTRKYKYGNRPEGEAVINYENEYDENKHLKSRKLDVSQGGITGEILYFDDNGNLTAKEANVSGRDRSNDYFGGVEYSHTEYTKNENGEYTVYSDKRKTDLKTVKDAEFKVYNTHDNSVLSLKDFEIVYVKHRRNTTNMACHKYNK